MKTTQTLLDLQATQERAWKTYVDTVLKSRQVLDAAFRAFDKAEKALKEAVDETNRSR